MKVVDKKDIINRIESLRAELRKLGVARLYLFGSFAANLQSDESDVDLLIDFEKGGKSYANFYKAHQVLENTLDRKVELLTRQSLKPFMREKILHGAKNVFIA